MIRISAINCRKTYFPWPSHVCTPYVGTLHWTQTFAHERWKSRTAPTSAVPPIGIDIPSCIPCGRHTRHRQNISILIYQMLLFICLQWVFAVKVFFCVCMSLLPFVVHSVPFSCFNFLEMCVASFKIRKWLLFVPCFSFVINCVPVFCCSGDFLLVIKQFRRREWCIERLSSLAPLPSAHISTHFWHIYSVVITLIFST